MKMIKLNTASVRKYINSRVALRDKIKTELNYTSPFLPPKK